MYQQLAGLIRQQLQHQHQDLLIRGENFNPGSGRLQLAQLLGLAKMAVIVLLLFGINPWHHLQAGPTPSLVTWALENKLYACLMTFFLCNMVETQLISSGAFEVSVNGELIWSKLETGAAPQPQQLVRLVSEKLQQQAEGLAEKIEHDFHSDQL